MDRTGDAASQRRHPRIARALPLRLRVTLHGFEPSASEEGFEARGESINLSRGGILLRADRRVTEGSRCLVHLPDARDIVGREMIYGTVRRVAEGDGFFRVAVEFDTPLAVLDQDAG